MEANAGPNDNINHGESLDFSCKENRTLAASKDPDEDGLFNVPCYNGEFERVELWPDKEQVCEFQNKEFIAQYPIK